MRKRRAHEARDIDFAKVRLVRLGRKGRKMGVGDMAGFPRKGRSFSSFEKALPGTLSAVKFRRIADAIARAAREGRSIIWMIGAQVIKVGLSPVLIELMRRRALTALTMNGAGAIHDFELAAAGATSEDVAAGLNRGTFGMSRETGAFMAAALRERPGLGFGAAMGKAMEAKKLRFRDCSLLYNCSKLGLPATVHVALGTDTVHQQPSARGEDIGRSSLMDFRRFCGIVACLERGVVLNVGSAVILPEVFLKALTVARNLGKRVRKFTAVNLDMNQHYRPSVNVIQRPVALEAEGLALTGHHELLVPMLAQAVIERL